MTGALSGKGDHAVQVVVGVDIHQDQHVAVASDGRGVYLCERQAPATIRGYSELERWARSLGEICAFGIEGTGSFGAGVTRYLTGLGYAVFEVNRPDRLTRYRKGKSDPTDAEAAARAVLSGVADATPKSGEGEVEMIRMLKCAKDSAVKARTQAVNQMKALVVTAPAELRELLDGLSPAALASRCKSFRPRPLNDPTARRQVRSSFPCLPVQPTEQRNQKPGDRTVTTYQPGIAGPGQHLRNRARQPRRPCWSRLEAIQNDSTPRLLSPPCAE